MKTVITPELQELMAADHYRPAVSIILPIEAKINLQTELKHTLKIATDKVKIALTKNYPDEICQAVLNRLNNLLDDMEIQNDKKSIGIFVSPVFTKVVYLDITVDEKIIIDESFEIRDLVYSNKQLLSYLVLVLSSKGSRMYLGDTDSSFMRILPEYNENMDAYVNDVSERVLNFSDVAERKEVLLDKFLHHVNDGLDAVLKSYRLPLFILCSERIEGHFKKISKQHGTSATYIHGNYEEVSPDKLHTILEPHIAALKELKQAAVIRQLEDAIGQKKLVFGIKDVWREVMSQKGKLLVVEKNYMCASQRGSHNNLIDTEVYSQLSLSKMSDAVDEIIEKVLEQGGDIEFVEDGALKDYLRIALVLYY